MTFLRVFRKKHTIHVFSSVASQCLRWIETQNAKLWIGAENCLFPLSLGDKRRFGHGSYSVFLFFDDDAEGRIWAIVKFFLLQVMYLYKMAITSSNVKYLLCQHLENFWVDCAFFFYWAYNGNKPTIELRWDGLSKCQKFIKIYSMLFVLEFVPFVQCSLFVSFVIFYIQPV